ncbi:transcription-repair coupling factor [Futiania mangrovi]|uniref:transcription-repair coupling factor n=1 Tax=Futiania mangrovi TaxID=2959716 RepID=UPI0022AF05D7|nr:transcription-repair coupling factor [Futiania mangrovii]
MDTRIVEASGRLTLAGVPEGADALLLADMARAEGGPVLHLARDASRMAATLDALQFFAPDVVALAFPSWDCLPYDRVSPSPEIAATRLATLAHLATGKRVPTVVVASVNAFLQRVPVPETLAGSTLALAAGNVISTDELMGFFARNGYGRVGTVRAPGDFAVRGGIVDLWPAGLEEPIRLDFFGDTLETIRTFDADSQKTTGQVARLMLAPASEVQLTEETIRRFRREYVSLFGAVTGADPLYEAVSAGQRHQGMEHWLPLFHAEMGTLADHVPGAPVTLDFQAAEARDERIRDYRDYYDARAAYDTGKGGIPAYRPVPPERLYLDADEWEAVLADRRVRQIHPHAMPESGTVIDLGGRPGRDFAPERRQEGTNVFHALVDHLKDLARGGRNVFVASYSEGARERLTGLLKDHGAEIVVPVDRWEADGRLPKGGVGVMVLGLDHGFETPGFAVVSEQDVLGDRLVRAGRKQRRAENFLQEVSSLHHGDLVVHVDHGIGRYLGLETITVMDAPHDCLMIEYHGGDKLYLPVENLELLTRYGSEEMDVTLDRLGGGAWQARKARLKERIKELADQLIKVAALRALKTTEGVAPPHGLYEEFCARFPYEETEDQQRAIADVLTDLGSGHPMDRLVCGDVGFGKTEIALRAAFIMAMQGRQVAVVVPTTLLARQHYKGFVERFKGWPVRIGQLSRMVGAKEQAATRAGIADGTVDIVIGTHALLGKQVAFKDLGLLVIDEEQHFGVQHKERLKQLRADVHVLTLTATPIPRTMQLAMTGVRELSIIATPPVDRLAVRTYVAPFDPVTVREALLREKYRGGQSFVVVPRIADLAAMEAFLKDEVPEVRYAIAHGQMAAGALDEIMNAFYDGAYDVLLSTSIVESGLDIPTANTMIVHRADMFGLAQLYQIRGRIGRAKARAYAHLTTVPNKKLTPAAERRLRVLQSLDTLGAGFSLASHDLDIRGAGNLLGEEQSGHVKEVGFELYQHMLEEAVAQMRAGELDLELDTKWSPQINLGAAVLIPEHYVSDLDLRLTLYRRLADIEDDAGIEAIAAEMIDRFGPLPPEVAQLLEVVRIKAVCRRAGIAKIDAGPKGIIVSFREDHFANPAGLVEFLARERGGAKLRPDHKLVLARAWESVAERLKGTLNVARTLAGIAEAAQAAA